MKNILYALILFSQTAVCQNIKVSWSEESKKDLSFYNLVKGENKDLIKLCFDISNKEITPIITRYDNKLSVLNEENFLVNQDGVRFEKFLSIKSNLFLLSNYYDKSSKSTSFYSQPLDIKNLKAKGDNLNLETFPAKRNGLQAEAEFILSADSSKLLMLTRGFYEKNGAEKYQMNIYDNKMKKLWANNVTLPYKDKYVNVMSTSVTNDGQVAILLRYFDNEKVEEEMKIAGNIVPAYKIKLLLYNKSSPNPKEFNIDMGSKFISSISLCREVGNEIFLFCLYKNQSGRGNISGFFTAGLNTTNSTFKILNNSIFPASLIAQLEIDDQGSENKKDPGLKFFFKLSQTIERDNGDIDYLIQYEADQSLGGGGFNYSRGDIIDISVKKQDNKVVITRIPKYQYSRHSSKNLGFLALPYKDKLLLFYNEGQENIKKDITKKPDFFTPESMSELIVKKSDFVMAKIDRDGNFSREVIISGNDFKSIIAVNSSMRVDKNKLGLYATRSSFATASKDMVGVLEIEK